jgi:hypothetical protein
MKSLVPDEGICHSGPVKTMQRWVLNSKWVLVSPFMDAFVGRCNEKNFSLLRLAQFEKLASLKLPKSAGTPPIPPSDVYLTSITATVNTGATAIKSTLTKMK